MHITIRLFLYVNRQVILYVWVRPVSKPPKHSPTSQFYWMPAAVGTSSDCTYITDSASWSACTLERNFGDVLRQRRSSHCLPMLACNVFRARAHGEPFHTCACAFIVWCVCVFVRGAEHVCWCAFVCVSPHLRACLWLCSRVAAPPQIALSPTPNSHSLKTKRIK